MATCIAISSKRCCSPRRCSPMKFPIRIVIIWRKIPSCCCICVAWYCPKAQRRATFVTADRKQGPICRPTRYGAANQIADESQARKGPDRGAMGSDSRRVFHQTAIQRTRARRLLARRYNAICCSMCPAVSKSYSLKGEFFVQAIKRGCFNPEAKLPLPEELRRN